MRPPRLLLLCALLLGGWLAGARAAEPFFQKGDVIAIVGGEDMVALSEYGYLELLLTRALPDYHLRFRNLAWEGDTVFEQRRDLGFPPWEEQLAKIGATVVLCQFGQMESLAGQAKLPEFIAAYEKLIERFSGGGKRRVIMVAPTRFDDSVEAPLPTSSLLYKVNSRALLANNEVLDSYIPALKKVANEKDCPLVDETFSRDIRARIHHDGVHLDETGHLVAARSFCERLSPWFSAAFARSKPQIAGVAAPLRQLIIAKNRLWFDYWRPQNWAFLAGDRTAQPSSRDHLDPSKRWFPPEREAFLPLLEAKEKEIDALAAKLANEPSK